MGDVVNMPTYDDMQAANAQAAADHFRAKAERLAEQVARIPGLLQQIGALQVEVRDTREELAEARGERDVLKREIERWRAVYPDLPSQRMETR